MGLKFSFYYFSFIEVLRHKLTGLGIFLVSGLSLLFLKLLNLIILRTKMWESVAIDI